MKSRLFLILCGFLTFAAMNNADRWNRDRETQQGRRPGRLDAWRTGTEGPFTLLEPDATWTITGNSLAAKKYNTRDEFLDKVIKPFNARLTKPLVPTIHSLHSDGDTVIALFDGEATALDGKPYRNT
jgi:ketosteroid isomerase-like protein